ncbi:hypothetical protein [Lacrimispora sp.]|uniref:hypothetical protein n=1 Tax=Lacrimispora sp. TaxID=2719234 RepID=UPI00289D295B|nr:hypothetical protein [Lacrimispora sp.]
MILDIFNPELGARKEDWHPKVKLLDRPGLIGQKKTLENWTDGFLDRDGKIIREFQKNFHSSFWEFFLYAMFKEIGFQIDMTHHAPDFMVTAPYKINVEAVIANIREKGRQEETRDMDDILSMITPPFAQPDFYEVLDESIFRMSNSIIKKHKKYLKDYSKHDWISKETPYVIAACSYDQINYGREYIYSMLALLYGFYYDAKEDTFNWKETIKKPSSERDIQLGLFFNSEYCEISAIIYSSMVTIGKLTAMHISQGGVSDNFVLQLWKDHDSSERPYAIQIVGPEAPELLTEGIFVFHNPTAKHSLPLDAFHQNGIVQYYFVDGVLHTDAKQETIARLDLPRIMMDQLYPYIEQQMSLYNRLDIYDIYTPKNKCCH